MDKNYKQCVNKDFEGCILWSACEDCYYFKLNENVQEIVLRCINCCREIPNLEHLYKNGCRWCVQEKE